VRPGREIDTRIAREVFGHRVWAEKKTLFESAEKGDRPLRNYSRDIEWAIAVAEKMKMTLIPIVGGDWFAFVGPMVNQGWESPQAVLKFLEAGQFQDCGASVGNDLAFVICEAALRATEKRIAATGEVQPSADNVTELRPQSEEQSHTTH
jgi:hypothetical protein